MIFYISFFIFDVFFFKIIIKNLEIGDESIENTNMIKYLMDNKILDVIYLLLE